MEFNKYLIRVSNNGISSFINNYGNIIIFIPLNTKNKKDFDYIFPSKLNNLFNFHKFIYLFILIIAFIAIKLERKIDKL